GALCKAITVLPANCEGERLKVIVRGHLRDLALNAANDLSEMKRFLVEKGRKEFLMDALDMFLECGFDIPPWVLRALSAAIDCEKKSWDEVFGKPKKKCTKNLFDEITTAYEEGERLLAEGYKTYDSHLFPELAIA